MRKIIFTALLAMVIPVSVFAAGEGMEAGKKDAGAMQGKHAKGHHAMKGECGDKKKAMKGGHKKEYEESMAKQGAMEKGVKEGSGAEGGKSSGGSGGSSGGYE